MESNNQHQQLSCYTDGEETYVAYSIEDITLIRNELGYSSDHKQEDPFVELPPSEQLTIRLDEEDELNPGQAKEVTKTIGEWIADNGRGLLCSDW